MFEKKNPYRHFYFFAGIGSGTTSTILGSYNPSDWRHGQHVCSEAARIVLCVIGYLLVIAFNWCFIFIKHFNRCNGRTTKEEGTAMCHIIYDEYCFLFRKGPCSHGFTIICISEPWRCTHSITRIAMNINDDYLLFCVIIYNV